MPERKPQTYRKTGLPRRPGRDWKPAPADRIVDHTLPLWLYGHHAVAAVLANPRRKWSRLVATRNAARDLEGREPEILEAREIDKLLPDGAVHQGLAVLAEPLPVPGLSELLVRDGRPLIFLDHVTDPHNVGAILRSAAAFSARGVIATHRHAPPITGVLAKAASGAVEHVPYVQLNNLAEALVAAGEAGFVRLGLDERGEPLDDALAATSQFPVALVLGAEGAGLRERTRATCDRLVRLPTTGPIGALNVSNAAAVALYAITASAKSAAR